MHGHMYLHAWTYVCVHTYMDAWMHGCMCKYTHACMAMHVYIPTHSYEYAHMGTYIDTWMHVWIYEQSQEQVPQKQGDVDNSIKIHYFTKSTIFDLGTHKKS